MDIPAARPVTRDHESEELLSVAHFVFAAAALYAPSVLLDLRTTRIPSAIPADAPVLAVVGMALLPFAVLVFENCAMAPSLGCPLTRRRDHRYAVRHQQALRSSWPPSSSPRPGKYRRLFSRSFWNPKTSTSLVFAEQVEVPRSGREGRS